MQVINGLQSISFDIAKIDSFGLTIISDDNRIKHGKQNSRILVSSVVRVLIQWRVVIEVSSTLQIVILVVACTRLKLTRRNIGTFPWFCVIVWLGGVIVKIIVVITEPVSSSF